MRSFALVLVLLLAVTGAYCYAYDNGDFQVWNTEVEELKINDKSRLALEEEFRWGDNANDFYYYHFDLGYSYELNKKWVLGAGYRRIYEKKSGKFQPENRPYIYATPKWQARGFDLSDRNRLEYRNFNYKPDSWQYRNKLTAKFPWKFTALSVRPYLADEIFINLNDEGLVRNRFYSGLEMKLTKNFGGEIYYLLQRTKSAGKWTNANVLGTKLKFIF